ncbi:hypothetical protein, partial [Nocardiopsis trehalosi]|uniref:hypothetical protein n=1 Tax=Nocardiopsis trehalosi TaxID=109329 RepID=UPI000A53E64A
GADPPRRPQPRGDAVHPDHAAELARQYRERQRAVAAAERAARGLRRERRRDRRDRRAALRRGHHYGPAA